MTLDIEFQYSIKTYLLGRLVFYVFVIIVAHSMVTANTAQSVLTMNGQKHFSSHADEPYRVSQRYIQCNAAMIYAVQCLCPKDNFILHCIYFRYLHQSKTSVLTIYAVTEWAKGFLCSTVSCRISLVLHTMYSSFRCIPAEE